MFGLDISDASIEALELKKSFGRVKLVGYARMELPAGIVRDGIVLKKKELSKAIKKLIEEARPRPIRGREVILSLPESRVYTHVFKFPANLNAKQIAHILQFEVPNALPISLEEVYSDFSVLSREGGYQEVFFAAVLRKTVDDLKEVMKTAGLVPRVFDMESMSLARALGGVIEDGSVIVDIGARTTIISIFDKNGIRFTTNIEIAGNLLTETIAKNLKIKLEKAEELKKICGLIPKDGRCRDGRVFLIIQSVLQSILRDIQKAIKFYEGKSKQKIKKVILCGGSAMLPNIANYFQENLSLKVLVGKPEAAKDFSIPSGVISPLLLNVFGLAMRGAGRKPESEGINLIFGLDEMVKGKRRIKQKGLKYLAVGAIALALLGVGIFSFYKFSPQLISKFFTPNIIPVYFETRILSVGEAGQTSGKFLEVSKDAFGTFQATGKRIAEGRAEGKVKIINNSAGAQTLVATTRLLRNDILFRLKDRVTVLAGGEVEAAVYADQIGAAGDIGPGKFTIPGLSPTLQKLIYAESEAPMVGGAVETTVVSEADIEQAKEKLLAEITNVSILDEVKSNLAAGEILLPAVLETEILQLVAEPGQNEVASEFTMRLTAKSKFLAIDSLFLDNLMKDELVKRGIDKPGVYKFQNLEVSLVNFDKISRQAIIKVSAQAVNL